MHQLQVKRRRISENYSRIYAALSVIAGVISVLPVYSTIRKGALTVEYGSLWAMAARSPVGVIGILLLIALVGIYTALSFRPPVAAGAPLVGAVLSGIATIALLLKPGTGTEVPALAEGGLLLCACSVIAAVVCLVHAVHLTILSTGQRSGNSGDQE